MSENPYEAPSSSTTDTEEISARKPGLILVVCTILLVLINTFLSFILVYPALEIGGSYSIGYGIGYIAGRVLLLPIIVVALFRIGKRFRNSRSQTKIFLWTSVVALLSLLGNIGAAAQGQI